jgi:GNAT superfamily N-acetyltransferase
MPYNPPWYPELLEGWGLRPSRDLVAFWVDARSEGLDRFGRVARRALERGGYTLRAIRTDARGFEADVDHVLRLYNAAWEANWDFVPMTEDEVRHEARAMRAILEPSLVLFAEHEGAPVGFSLTLPDMNRALQRIRGRLWPWSLVRLLLAKRAIRRGRVITLGVVPGHRRSGLETALILRSIEHAEALGWDGAECSWVLDDNELIISAIERVGGRLDRRYRIYDRRI